MALFRFHRGSLDTSLATTVIVEDVDQLCDLLECIPGDLEIFPYPSAENNFDPRCGWYTHMVKQTSENELMMIGYLSETIK